MDLAASQSAFAALHSDGSVTCWGRGDAGGRGSAQGVARLRASARAFAAIRVDGTARAVGRSERPAEVTCWGHRDFGGDCGAVQAQLTGVAEVAATHSAFAALKSNGEVVTWGRPEHGGDRCGLRDVQHIEVKPHGKAFVAARGLLRSLRRAPGRRLRGHLGRRRLRRRQQRGARAAASRAVRHEPSRKMAPGRPEGASPRSST